MDEMDVTERTPDPFLHKGPVARALDGLASACMLIAGVQIVILIAIFGWLVFGRYVLNDTPTWVEQLSLILVVWIAFLGAAAGVWRHAHLSVDFFRESMPSAPRQLLRWIAAVMMIGFGAVMAWHGWELAEKTWSRRIPMLDIAEGWRAVPMAISGAMIALFSLGHLAALFRGDTWNGD